MKCPITNQHLLLLMVWILVLWVMVGDGGLGALLGFLIQITVSIIVFYVLMNGGNPINLSQAADGVLWVFQIIMLVRLCLGGSRDKGI